MAGSDRAETRGLVLNHATEEGRVLGKMFAGFCDSEIAKTGRQDSRCGTCAFRSGDHIANGSPVTVMDALKSALEGVPFWCHEHDRACSGWAVMRTKKGEELTVPWAYSGGVDQPA